MNSATVICQNCHSNFIIEPDDFAFYERIKVPPPTFCPECRQMRRVIFRNERTIYKRKCDLCQKEKVSIFHPSSPFKVYCYECFYSDNWNQYESGRDYDFSKPFFEQYRELVMRAPKLGLQKSNDLVNTEYGNHIGNDKNCYLVFASVNDEDCMYGSYISYSKNIVDGLRVFRSENCLECIDCQGCNNLKFSQQCQDSFDGHFLYSCRGCSNCFMCSNLVRGSYCIRNKQYSKEEYLKIIGTIDLGNRTKIDELVSEFRIMKEKTLQRSIEGFNHFGSVGNYLTNTKNCRNCFDLLDGENCRFVIYGNEAKDAMDAYAVYPKTELCYEVVGAGAPAYNAKFCYLPWVASNVTYCIDAFSGSHNCFGCNYIHKAQYCILNKQYTKEEYEELVPKIIKHMDEMPFKDSRGREYKYGEFFPMEFSPFAYNETIAQEHFPLTKEEALKQGYRWRDSDVRDYKITKKASEIPENIKDIGNSVLNEVIGCEHEGKCSEQCATAFKIVPEELNFYRRMNLPLPHLCPNCRHAGRLKQRNPFKLWHRKCQCIGGASENGAYKNAVNHQHGAGKCPNEFETSYSPERKETVYCEQCYQAEVV